MRRSRFSRIFLLVFLIGQSVLLSGCGSSQISNYTVDLQVWGVFDDSDAYLPAFGTWQKINPFVGKIDYKKFAVDTYKQDLLNALAAGNGPDIFMIRNSWLPEFQDKVTPVPDGLVDARAFNDAFVDVASQDCFGSDGKMYAVPLSVDSLALYYNRDLFNAAGINSPPTTWEELQQDASRLTAIDAFGTVVTAGASLGGWDSTPSRLGNINRASDVFLALVAQRGGLPTAASHVDFNGNAVRSAMDFYLQFSSARSSAYSWNPSLHNSLDAFAEGRLAMTVNYSWQYPVFKRKNAKLNIATAPLPQFSGSTGSQVANFANYWIYVVAKNTQNRGTAIPGPNAPATLATANPAKFNAVRILEAWQFLKFLAFPNGGTVTLTSGVTGKTKDFPMTLDPAKDYMVRTQKPAARRDLIALQKTDPIYGPFAGGNLIARSWQQKDPESVEGIINDGLAQIVTGMSTPNDGLRSIETRLTPFQNANNFQ